MTNSPSDGQVGLLPGDGTKGLNKLTPPANLRGPRPRSSTVNNARMASSSRSEEIFGQRMVPIDWKTVAGVDIGKIMAGGGWSECEMLQKVLPSVTFSSLAAEFPDVPLPQEVVKIYRLAQLIIQYLLHSQDKLADAVEILQRSNLTLKKEALRIEGKSREAELEIKQLRLECKKRRKMIEIQQNCLVEKKDPSVFGKCQYCPKTFINRSYLDSHLERRHPEKQPKASFKPQSFPSYPPPQGELNKGEERGRRQVVEEATKEIQTIASPPSTSASNTTGSSSAQVHGAQSPGWLTTSHLRDGVMEENKRLQKVVEENRAKIDELELTKANTRRDMDQLVSLEEINLLVKKQASKIDRLSAQSTQNDSVQGKLASQERFWQARVESIVWKHNEEMKRIQHELDAMQMASKEAKAQLERHIRHTCAEETRHAVVVQRPPGGEEESAHPLSRTDPLQTRSSVEEAREVEAHLPASLPLAHPPFSEAEIRAGRVSSPGGLGNNNLLRPTEAGTEARAPLGARNGERGEVRRDPNYEDGGLVQIPRGPPRQTAHRGGKNEVGLETTGMTGQKIANGTGSPQIGERMGQPEGKQVEWSNGPHLEPFPVSNHPRPPIEAPDRAHQPLKNNGYENVFKKDHQPGEVRSNLLDHEYSSMRSLWHSSQDIRSSVNDLAEENPGFLAKYRKNAKFDLELLLEELGLDPHRTKISDAELNAFLAERKREQKQSKHVSGLRKKCKIELNGLIKQSMVSSLPNRNSVANSSFELRLGRRLNSARHQVLKTWRNALRSSNAHQSPGDASILPKASSFSASTRTEHGLDHPSDGLEPSWHRPDPIHGQDCLFRRKPLPNIYLSDPQGVHGIAVHGSPTVKASTGIPIPAPRYTKERGPTPTGSACNNDENSKNEGIQSYLETDEPPTKTSMRQIGSDKSDISSISNGDVVHQFESDISEADQTKSQRTVKRAKHIDLVLTDEDQSSHWDSELGSSTDNPIAPVVVYAPNEDEEDESDFEEILYEVDASKIRLKKPPPGSKIDQLKNRIESQLRNRSPHAGPIGGVDLNQQEEEEEDLDIGSLSLEEEKHDPKRLKDSSTEPIAPTRKLLTRGNSWDSNG